MTALAVSAAAQTGELRLGEAVMRDAAVSVPVQLSGAGEPVAGLDALFSYDPAVFELLEVVEAEALTGAGKRVASHERGAGRVVLVVQGLNRTAIPPGDIATVRLRVREAAPGQETALVLSRTTLTTPDAGEVPSEGAIRTVTFERRTGAGVPAGPLRPRLPDDTGSPGDSDNRGEGPGEPAPDAPALNPAIPVPLVRDDVASMRDTLEVAMREAEAARNRIRREGGATPSTVPGAGESAAAGTGSDLLGGATRDQGAEDHARGLLAGREPALPPANRVSADEPGADAGPGSLAGARTTPGETAGEPAAPARATGREARAPNPGRRRAAGWAALAAGATLLAGLGVTVWRSRLA
jgi:hypothetical protein